MQFEVKVEVLLTRQEPSDRAKYFRFQSLAKDLRAKDPKMLEVAPLI